MTSPSELNSGLNPLLQPNIQKKPDEKSPFLRRTLSNFFSSSRPKQNKLDITSAEYPPSTNSSTQELEDKINALQALIQNSPRKRANTVINPPHTPPPSPMGSRLNSKQPIPTFPKIDPSLGKMEEEKDKNGIEVRRYSKQIEIKTIPFKESSPQQILNQQALADPTSVAEALILFFYKEETKVVNTLLTYWNSIINLSTSTSGQEKEIEQRLKNQTDFYELLATLSTYDKGIPIVCAYFRRFINLERTSSQDTQLIAGLIYKRHTDKNRLWDTLPLFTAADLKTENIGNLLREEFLTRYLCQTHLSKVLGPTLQKLIDEFKHSQNQKKLIKGSHSNPIHQFLTHLYGIEIHEDVKKLIKIRTKAIHERFENHDQLQEAIFGGLNELLFLSFINSECTKQLLLNTILNNNPKEKIESSKILTQSLKCLANQKSLEPGVEGAKDVNPIYKEFKDTHLKFIQKILKE